MRWPVLNAAALLRRHAALQDQLAAAMERGESVGRCVALIERELAGRHELLAPPGAVAAAAAGVSESQSSIAESDTSFAEEE